MKKGIQPDISEFFFSGKSILIIIVIIISGFSFGLGYLVGKRSDSFSEKKLVEKKNNIDPVPQSVSPEEFDRTLDKIIHQDLELTRNSEPASSETEVRSDEEPLKKTSSDITEQKIYRIQVGAFKRLADAKRLKQKLDINGFNSYILTVKLKKGDLYKVRAGKFNSLSEAEEQASEIKKMKGLDAFVLIEK